jgi:hypothetical protein
LFFCQSTRKRVGLVAFRFVRREGSSAFSIPLSHTSISVRGWHKTNRSEFSDAAGAAVMAVLAAAFAFVEAFWAGKQCCPSSLLLFKARLRLICNCLSVFIDTVFLLMANGL